MFSSSIVCCYLHPITKYGYPPKAENTVNYLQEMHDMGFRSVELEGIRENHLMGVYKNRDIILKKIDELNLNIPYFCIVLPGLSSPIEKERMRNLELFETGCEIAQFFGTKGVLDNAPLPPYQFPADIPVVRHYGQEALSQAFLPKNLKWDHYWKDLVLTYREACDIAAKYEQTFQMHPCLGVLSSNTDGFLNFHSAVQRDNLRFNLDTANQFMQHDNLILSVYRTIEFVDYIHISDNRGTKVEHLVPGDGNIPWDTFFEVLDRCNFKGHLGIDVGGDESGVKDIDAAFIQTAKWLEKKWKK